MTYKVVAETTPDCDCDDCRAGRHHYSLFCWGDDRWMHVGFSLLTYTSPEDCMKNHWWGVQFEPDAVWEDGSPVVPPEPPTSADREDGTPGNQRMVTLDGEALARSLEFGSSDYRRSRTSHLFYSKRRPSFRWFDEKIRQLFQPDIRPQRLALTPAPGAAEGSVRLRRSAGAGRVRRVGAGGWETAG